jgi:hypothetical protein
VASNGANVTISSSNCMENASEPTECASWTSRQCLVASDSARVLGMSCGVTLYWYADNNFTAWDSSGRLPGTEKCQAISVGNSDVGSLLTSTQIPSSECYANLYLTGFSCGPTSEASMDEQFQGSGQTLQTGIASIPNSVYYVMMAAGILVICVLLLAIVFMFSYRYIRKRRLTNQMLARYKIPSPSKTFYNKYEANADSSAYTPLKESSSSTSSEE